MRISRFNAAVEVRRGTILKIQWDDSPDHRPTAAVVYRVPAYGDAKETA